MSDDYFDQLEREVRKAVRSQTHLRWYTRLRLRHTRALVACLGVLIIATPAVAAVSGVFGPGKPDPFYPESKTSGGGQAIAGTRILPIRVADPDGGPPWGMRLVKTTRDDTCVQVGRVEFGELGSLGIDDSWANDHLFHPINPNDGPADICGASDSVGHGFVSADWNETASAYVPSDSGSGAAATYCQNPNDFRESPTMLKRQQAARGVHTCPAGSGRLIFVGLLGPDAQSITYKTPSGAIKTEDTVGGVGAYLIIFRQTARSCSAYGTSLNERGSGCQNNGGSEYPSLRLPNAVLSVTYKNGHTCSDEPTASFVALFDQYQALYNSRPHLNAKEAQALFAKFLSAHHLTAREWGADTQPECAPVGFVQDRQPALTSAQVRSPITFTVVKGTRFCANGPAGQAYKGTIVACPSTIPRGYHRFYEVGRHQKQPELALVTATFIARQPVTTSNSWYEWQITTPGNHGGQGNQTNMDIRRGQRITFTMFESADKTGTYRGFPGIYRATVSYMQNAGQAGSQSGSGPGRDGSITVARFSFRLLK